jgi:hypothetical protein
MKLQTSLLSVFVLAALGSTISTVQPAVVQASAPVTSLTFERSLVHLPVADRDYARPALRGLMGVTAVSVVVAVPSVVPAGLPPQLVKRPTVVVVPPTPPARKPITPALSAVAVGAVQRYALSVLSPAQYGCLAAIVHREDPSWSPTRYNQGGSGAYGIPQALPGWKMATAGADWRTNGITQVKWMIGYVKAKYGSACSAWAYWKVHYSY